MLFKKNIKTEFKELIELLKSTLFKEEDIKIVEDFILHGEEPLAIEHVITQLYEFDVIINLDTYGKIEGIATSLKIKKTGYQILEELIKWN